jgi:transposase
VALGHDVKVVAATLVRELGVGHRGIKTDKRDAQALSAASCRIELPSVHLRSQRGRDLQSRLGARYALVTARTQLINVVRGFLRMHLISVRGTSEHFAKNARAALLETPLGVADFIEGLLNSIEALSTQIAAADDSIELLAKVDPVAPRLMTVPGVGPITSMMFVAVVDDIARFPSVTALESYTGLTPGERSSSKRVRRTGITKAGPSLLRHALTQASLTLMRTRPLDAGPRWAAQVRERRGKQIATIAMARKLVRIMYALWRDGTAYRG